MLADLQKITVLAADVHSGAVTSQPASLIFRVSGVSVRPDGDGVPRKPPAWADDPYRVRDAVGLMQMVTVLIASFMRDQTW